ncbi:hypothetical protein MPSEU_000906200 [Mayamaea pseudoterrestris]|nr:hypothetical protein MPSEU_000906200 [Mayamaea pseudoterrestris]
MLMRFRRAATPRAVTCERMQLTRRPRPANFAFHSSLATANHHLHDEEYDDEDDDYSNHAVEKSSSKHCSTCSCETSARLPPTSDTHALLQQLHPLPSFTSCRNPLHDPMEPLPRPNPEPKYSVRRRILPSCLTPLNSPAGRQLLVQSLTLQTAASYLTLTEHSVNQSDPAYCGVTTLLIVLNALAVDPMIRWKGGWRYYGSEEMLLATCQNCLDVRRIEREGITLPEFCRMAECQGLDVTLKQPICTGSELADNHVGGYRVDDFRRDVIELLSESGTEIDSQNDVAINNDNLNGQHQRCPGILVVSFGRPALEQTGDGHFSPIAAYHAETDQVLILDVARFKYQHYWVKIDTLYRAMQLLDKKTEQPRGWFKLHAPIVKSNPASELQTSLYYNIHSEDRRDVKFVPLACQGHPCPVHSVKVDFCSSAAKNRPPSGFIE